MDNTVYLNELSIDESFSELPADKNGAKEVLLEFVKSCLTYIISVGYEEDVVMSIHANHYHLIFEKLNFGYGPGRLLKELVIEGAIEEDAVKRFQMFIGDAFVPSWEPEYIYENRQVYGLGEAHLKETYTFSFNTKLKHKDSNWNFSDIEINVEPAEGQMQVALARNITTSSHVIEEHNCWKDCSYKNVKTSNECLFPLYRLSEIIINGYGFEGWNDFYADHQNIDRTQRLEIAKVYATINGWEYLGKKQDNQWTFRDTYQAQKYYLQVDTEQDAFEVYKGLNNHIGEIKFNSNGINKAKANNTRFIRE